MRGIGGPDDSLIWRMPFAIPPGRKAWRNGVRPLEGSSRTALLYLRRRLAIAARAAPRASSVAGSGTTPYVWSSMIGLQL